MTEDQKTARDMMLSAIEAYNITLREAEKVHFDVTMLKSSITEELRVLDKEIENEKTKKKRKK